MDSFDQALRDMDISFFGSGEYAVSPEDAGRMIGKEAVFFLDVRTPEETERLQFPFAHRIPVQQLPDRIGELPKDKLIVIICCSVFRAGLIYGYLLHKGFDEVKGLAGSSEQMATVCKPGPIFKSMS